MMEMRPLARTALLWPIAVGAALLVGCGSGEGSTTARVPAPPPHHGKAPANLPVGDGNGGVTLTKLADFSEPLYVTQPRGESADLFVVQRGGQIRVIHDGRVEPQPFLDVGSLITTAGEEQGLLSMAFAPDYRSSGRFYVYYTNPSGNIRIVEYERSSDDPLRADPGSAREVLGIPHSQYSNHNGGLLVFGPDGYLYAGVGDGGGGGDQNRRGQDLSTLLGKILRIDPRPQGGKPHGIPQDNPFAGRAGARPEIFEYGLRNPWRFSFDPKTDAQLIGDVGQDNFEEVDYLPRGRQAGANLGWSAFEAYAPYNTDQKAPAAIAPILAYGTHSDSNCSVTGGYVVRDPALRSLYGRYLYGDFCAGELRSLIPSLPRAKDDKPLGLSVSSLSSFGEDAAGHVYATSLSGPVYRLDPG
jgi:glucose/arabinose dehydrogenase